jgi:hypothetical protein
MTGTPRAVALVESPAQLLNVIEWAYAQRAQGDLDPARVGTGMSIIILPPPEPAARLQLDRMTELARAVGFTVSWHEVRGSSSARLRALGTIAAHTTRVPILIIGDPFSGWLQFAIDLTRAERLVVVDDGSATLRFAEIMDSSDELVRWHRAGPGPMVGRRVAARAKHRLLRGRVELFTSMPVTSRTMDLRRNDLGWTRQRFLPPESMPGADLVGSSLVESDVVGEHHYLRAVTALAAAHRVTRYLAHRREGYQKLAKIADLGLEVVRPDLPLELFSRIGPISNRVISFPSTVVHTLPLALADARVEVLVCDIDQQWFKPGRSQARSGNFLRSVASTARRTHGLSSAAVLLEPFGQGRTEAPISPGLPAISHR